MQRYSANSVRPLQVARGLAFSPRAVTRAGGARGAGGGLPRGAAAGGLRSIMRSGSRPPITGAVDCGGVVDAVVVAVGGALVTPATGSIGAAADAAGAEALAPATTTGGATAAEAVDAA